ncbi:hypothetical protein KIPB_011562, partial [Kipferlia bialata]
AAVDRIRLRFPRVNLTYVCCGQGYEDLGPFLLQTALDALRTGPRTIPLPVTTEATPYSNDTNPYSNDGDQSENVTPLVSPYSTPGASGASGELYSSDRAPYATARLSESASETFQTYETSQTSQRAQEPLPPLSGSGIRAVLSLAEQIHRDLAYITRWEREALRGMGVGLPTAVESLVMAALQDAGHEVSARQRMMIARAVSAAVPVRDGAREEARKFRESVVASLVAQFKTALPEETQLIETIKDYQYSWRHGLAEKGKRG